ncbi:hypothetical protein [Jeongeupia sp. USM3]|uniref:hypothetical protein n=1 Tax=Jeongeupia sp. USM3 TaxID=1906741 RepID=UPI0011AB8A74|nr:hypothetical protein [Jeongeupia sp. USM3]
MESKFEDLEVIRSPAGGATLDIIEYIINGGPVIQKNPKTNSEEARWPEFCSVRTVVDSIERQITNNQFVILCGRRFSGKTTALIQCLERIKNYQSHYFSSQQPLNSRPIDLVRGVSNSLFIFDSNYLRANIIGDLIKYGGSNKFIIARNSYESAIYNEFAMSSDVQWVELEIEPRLNDREYRSVTESLNMAGVALPEKGDTFLNYAYKTYQAHRAQFSSRTFDLHLTPSHYKALTILGAFSKAENIHIKSIFDHGFNLHSFVENSSKLFDMERHNGESVLVCNSNQWLVRVLSDYAQEKHDEAAKIVADVVRQLHQAHIYDAADELINFDLLNNLFSWDKKGRASFFREVYKNLADIYGSRSHYWLQMAKSELMISRGANGLRNGVAYAVKVKNDNAKKRNKTYFSATLTLAQLYSRLYVEQPSEDVLFEMLDMYIESINNFDNNSAHVRDIVKRYKRKDNAIHESINALAISQKALEKRRDDVAMLITFMNN